MVLTNVLYAGLFVALGAGCQVEPGLTVDVEALDNYEQKMSVREEPAQPAPQEGKRPMQRMGRLVDKNAGIYEKLHLQVPDPIEAREYIDELLREDQTRNKLTKSEKRYFAHILENLDSIDRPRKIELTLSEVVRRALENSYTIRVESYNPAINATAIVEAEAVFDAVFFSTVTLNKSNTPTATQLQPTGSTSRNFDTGLRKLLPTGASVTAVWNVNRQEVDNFRFATLNPSYRNQFTVTVRQPFLRGFGLDFNRFQINIAKLNRGISQHAFQRQVRDLLAEVERAYWQLVGARRVVVIEGRLIAEFQGIYDDLYARRNFDVSQVELSDSKARLDATIAAFVRVKNNVKDAEDRLKNMLNDPELNQADDIEIIPSEFPTAEEIVLDRYAQIQTALESRSELTEAELAIESARLEVGRAKNLALPRFDASFRYAYDALGKSQHDSFQNLSDLDFHNYAVGFEFEWPIGNRGPRAALRRSILQYAQSLARSKQLIEAIILEVDVALRELYTNFELIETNLRSVESQVAQVQAIEDRAEKRDANQLNRELNARQALGSARRNLLDSLLRYNFAITELERAKGSLLQYNSVEVIDIVNHAD